MTIHDLICLRPEGLYCPVGDFFIDPVVPVDFAVISHGHADHCRPGSTHLLATPDTVAIAQTRYGKDGFKTTQSLPYGESLRINDVTLTLIPAGHVLGSAQVVLEANGKRAIFTGDYKRSYDPTCAPFEVKTCDLFITEATFGLPVFIHPDPMEEIGKLVHSLEQFPEKCHVVGAYALGKAQRFIALLRQAGWEKPVFLHGALRRLCDLYEELGVKLGPLENATIKEKDRLRGQVVLAPPSAIADRWARRLPDPVICSASGWMRVRQRAKQKGIELPMILSDHADWPELQQTILETQAPEVWVTHGSEDALCHWCTQQGITARPLSIAGLGAQDAGEDS